MLGFVLWTIGLGHSCLQSSSPKTEASPIGHPSLGLCRPERFLSWLLSKLICFFPLRQGLPGPLHDSHCFCPTLPASGAGAGLAQANESLLGWGYARLLCSANLHRLPLVFSQKPESGSGDPTGPKAAISAERLPPAGDDGHCHQGLMGQETRGNKQVEHLDLHPHYCPLQVISQEGRLQPQPCLAAEQLPRSVGSFEKAGR